MEQIQKKSKFLAIKPEGKNTGQKFSALVIS